MSIEAYLEAVNEESAQEMKPGQQVLPQDTGKDNTQTKNSCSSEQNKSATYANNSSSSTPYQDLAQAKMAAQLDLSSIKSRGRTSKIPVRPNSNVQLAPQKPRLRLPRKTNNPLREPETSTTSQKPHEEENVENGPIQPQLSEPTNRIDESSHSNTKEEFQEGFHEGQPSTEVRDESIEDVQEANDGLNVAPSDPEGSQLRNSISRFGADQPVFLFQPTPWTPEEVISLFEIDPLELSQAGEPLSDVSSLHSLDDTGISSQLLSQTQVQSGVTAFHLASKRGWWIGVVIRLLCIAAFCLWSNLCFNYRREMTTLEDTMLGARVRLLESNLLQINAHKARVQHADQVAHLMVKRYVAEMDALMIAEKQTLMDASDNILHEILCETTALWDIYENFASQPLNMSMSSLNPIQYLNEVQLNEFDADVGLLSNLQAEVKILETEKVMLATCPIVEPLDLWLNYGDGEKEEFIPIRTTKRVSITTFVIAVTAGIFFVWLGYIYSTPDSQDESFSFVGYKWTKAFRFKKQSEPLYYEEYDSDVDDIIFIPESITPLT
ncbi:hypothetical protein AeMF1_004977 [Aphanomyces euteiches]|nr:hypothetical protein AeMF1_004977 [Aphanomyces euteiches]KAH9185956.1 hypothetical protein AeNC1_012066 [Aphanomyces euteiches]